MFPQVEWVLEQLASVADAQPADHPLHRVDRDNSEVYETGATIDMATPIRTRTQALKQANFVGATLASRERSPIGTEYDYDVSDVVRVRVEGLHYTEKGHIDSDGSGGVAFWTLVEDTQDAIDTNATFPSVPGYSGSYTHLLVTNDDPQLSGLAGFYAYSYDVELNGYEDR